MQFPSLLTVREDAETPFLMNHPPEIRNQFPAGSLQRFLPSPSLWSWIRVLCKSSCDVFCENRVERGGAEMFTATRRTSFNTSRGGRKEREGVFVLEGKCGEQQGGATESAQLNSTQSVFTQTGWKLSECEQVNTHLGFVTRCSRK